MFCYRNLLFLKKNISKYILLSKIKKFVVSPSNSSVQSHIVRIRIFLTHCCFTHVYLLLMYSAMFCTAFTMIICFACHSIEPLCYNTKWGLLKWPYGSETVTTEISGISTLSESEYINKFDTLFVRLSRLNLILYIWHCHAFLVTRRWLPDQNTKLPPPRAVQQ